MEYPLILRNEDETEILIVESEAQELEAAPKFRRRSAWKALNPKKFEKVQKSKLEAESAPVEAPLEEVTPESFVEPEPMEQPKRGPGRPPKEKHG